MIVFTETNLVKSLLFRQPKNGRTFIDSSKPPLDRVSPNILNTMRAKYNNKLLKSMENKS